MDVSDGTVYEFDYDGYSVEKTKRSLRAHNTNRTTHRGHVENTYRLAKASPSKEVGESMRAYHEAYKRTQRAIEQAWEHLMSIDATDENEKAMKKAMEELAAERMDVDSQVMHTFGIAFPVAKPKVGDGDDKTCKPNQALKPDELTAASKPTDYAAWLERFKTYYSSSRMGSASYEEQHQYIYACMSAELRTRIKQHVRPNTPVIKNPYGQHKSIEEMLTEEFRTLYPLTTRRFEWLNQKMKSSWASHYAKMKEFSDAADVSAMDGADFEAFALIIGIPDGEMRNEMLRLDHPTPAALDRIGQSYDRTGASQTHLGAPAAPTAKAFAVQQRSQGGGQRGPAVEKVRPDLVDKCKRCGAPLSAHSSKDCPKKKETCYLCKKKGHIAAVCLKSAVGAQGASARALTYTPQGQQEGEQAAAQPSQPQQQQQLVNNAWPTPSSASAYSQRAQAFSSGSQFLPYSASPVPSVFDVPRINTVRGPNAPTPHLGL